MPTDKMALVDTLLASFHSARGHEARARFADVLVGMQVIDDRILAALVGLLANEPFCGALYLAKYGDARAIPDLVRALDSDDLVAKADCAICAAESVNAIASAILELGGSLSDAQRARMDRIAEEAARQWQPGPDALPLGPLIRKPARRDPRPGRNAPCPCGSGKKYKKCCALEADAAGPVH